MLAHKGTIKLETERLILRKFVLNDAEDMFLNCTHDADVTTFLSWMPHNSVSDTLNVIDDWIKSYENIATYSWCIVSKEDEKVIGHITVNDISDRHEICEIGYFLGRKYWNKGLMTEALKAVIKFLFDEVGVNRIQAKFDSENIASGKVMAKAGMKYEGTLKQYKKRKDGTFGSSNIYAILRDEL